MRVGRRLASLLVTPLGILLFGALIVPFGILVVYSFFTATSFEIHHGFHVSNYGQIFSQGQYGQLAWNTLAIAAPTTILTVLGGFVIAYYIVFLARRRTILLALVIISMMASYLARIYAWRTLMGQNGIINSFLESTGLIHQPVQFILFSRFSVVAAEVNLYLPFATLLLYASLSGVEPHLRDAGRDLGAGRAQVLRRVTLPLSGPALLAAIAFTFFLSSGDYITPSLLGGTASGQTFGTAIAAQLGQAYNYPLGAAMSFVMLAAFLVFFVIIRWTMRASGLLPTAH